MQPLSAQQEISSGPGRRLTAPAIAAAVLAFGLVVGAVTLWAHYGTAVFFEMIAAGFSACF
ncbi:conserved protein of unknown function [Bradyrhizobium sp. ORS 285]|uniref:hypothetical protein n=1 Tax=Bradyrhizobium sp. ORS 285 TaxID=115808 RepID=UPI0002409B24|nr:hypothetical protein [Bradyrhizobium sp. ORS 285]CCD89893.1 conserved hypothetical protein [Bradyrhizobium sp. ORS 285]SMX61483.1 conserved protein of unknown function [Bradyrhizobium sp. ORS 285]